MPENAVESQMTQAGKRFLLTSLLLGVARVTLAQQSDDSIRIFAEDQYSYDDNLFRIPSAVDPVAAGIGTSRHDRINTTAVGLNVQKTLSAQQLQMALYVANSQFAHNTDLNNTSGRASAQLQWTASSALQGNVGSSFSRSLAGFTDTTYFARDLIETTQIFGTAHLRIRASWYLDGAVSDTKTIHSADQRQGDDFHGKSASLGTRYVTPDDNYIGINYRYSNGHYPSSIIIDEQSFDPSFHDSLGQILIKYALAQETELDISAGYLKRDYPNSPLGAFSGQIWRASLNWSISDKTHIAISTWRDLTAAVDAESDYFVTRGVSLVPTWSPTERIHLKLDGSIAQQDYINAARSVQIFDSRNEHVKTLASTIEYDPRDLLTLRLAYNIDYRSSNRDRFNYTDRTIGLTAVLKFER
jgi:Putative beta-barrel porin 2